MFPTKQWSPSKYWKTNHEMEFVLFHSSDVPNTDFPFMLQPLAFWNEEYFLSGVLKTLVFFGNWSIMSASKRFFLDRTIINLIIIIIMLIVMFDCVSSTLCWLCWVFASSHRKRMKVKIVQWHAVASWTWDAQDETCGICRMPFDGCCPDCKLPGDDCPLSMSFFSFV